MARFRYVSIPQPRACAESCGWRLGSEAEHEARRSGNDGGGDDDHTSSKSQPPPPPPLSGGARDPYEVLGLEKGADKAAVRKAYRALARTHHPDVSDEADAEEKFIEIARVNTKNSYCTLHRVPMIIFSSAF